LQLIGLREDVSDCKLSVTNEVPRLFFLEKLPSRVRRRPWKGVLDVGSKKFETVGLSEKFAVGKFKSISPFYSVRPFEEVQKYFANFSAWLSASGNSYYWTTVRKNGAGRRHYNF
jgi:hypothetical protein